LSMKCPARLPRDLRQPLQYKSQRDTFCSLQWLTLTPQSGTKYFMYCALKLLDEMGHYVRHSVAITIQSDDCISVHFFISSYCSMKWATTCAILWQFVAVSIFYIFVCDLFYRKHKWVHLS
jgi:hypothetical protein